MILPDVNVLVYAFRADAPNHADYRRWLERTVASSAPFALSELVLSAVVRVLTHPSVFQPVTPLEEALDYVHALKSQPNAVSLLPGQQHWRIFSELCERVNARGSTVPDAYHAALAIEHGCLWVSADKGFTRFPGLRVRSVIG